MRDDDGRPIHPDHVPDVRDGLTRAERIILWQLYELQKELGVRENLPEDAPMGAGPSGRIAKAAVPTTMLYGRVVEHIDLSVAQFQRLLQRLVGR